jgi:hypothetical protein
VTDTKIKPALSPEQWKKEKDYAGLPYVLERAAYQVAGRTYETWDESLHALAALCLYGQPFGFSREDVKLLRESWPKGVYISTPHSPHERLCALADRMEALLPPE